MILRATFAVIAVLASHVSVAECFKYPPDVAELSGTVFLKTFFGPPGYGEDPVGDSKEQQILMALDAPICILEGRDDGLELPESDQRTITLVPQGNRWSTLRSAAGKHVRVRGLFWHAITAHHHTPLSLEVTSIEVLPK